MESGQQQEQQQEQQQWSPEVDENRDGGKVLIPPPTEQPYSNTDLQRNLWVAFNQGYNEGFVRGFNTAMQRRGVPPPRHGRVSDSHARGSHSHRGSAHRGRTFITASGQHFTLNRGARRGRRNRRGTIHLPVFESGQSGANGESQN